MELARSNGHFDWYRPRQLFPTVGIGTGSRKETPARCGTRGGVGDRRHLARATDARARTAPRSRFRRAPPHEDRIARERTRTLYPRFRSTDALARWSSRLPTPPPPLCRIAKTTTPTMSSSWTAPKRAAAPDALASPPASKRPKATARAPPRRRTTPPSPTSVASSSPFASAPSLRRSSRRRVRTASPRRRCSTPWTARRSSRRAPRGP